MLRRQFVKTALALACAGTTLLPSTKGNATKDQLKLLFHIYI